MTSDDQLHGLEAPIDTIDTEKTQEPTEARSQPQQKNVTSPDTQDAPDYVAHVLTFLGTASNGTLGGIAVGFAGVTYVVLGRIGLVLIGALGGIVLHATWQGQATTFGGAKTEGASSQDIIARVMDWRDSNKSMVDLEDDEYNNAGDLDFKDFRPETAAALTELVSATIRDYVEFWYAPVLPGEQSFPRACRQTLVDFLKTASRALSRKRPAIAFVDFMTNASSVTLIFFGELAQAIRSSDDVQVSAHDAVASYLETYPNSTLANIIDEGDQKRKFRAIADDMLKKFLDRASYNAAPVRVFLQQIFAGVVMEMSLQACSKPEWLNGWIVYLLEQGEPSLIGALDAGISAQTNGTPGKPNTALQRAAAVVANQTEDKKPTHKADDAMAEAMEEARRLSKLMAEEDEMRARDEAEQKRALDEAPPKMPPRPVELETEKVTPPPINVDINGHHSPDIATPTATSSRGMTIGPDEQRTLQDVSNSALKAGDSTSSLVSDSSSKGPATTFDQFVPQAQLATSPDEVVPELTLHNATITILEDFAPNDKSRLRSKPNDDILVQIEPASSRFPGWMIVRKYADFETLHEVLRRIAQVSGATVFAQMHPALPSWKNDTKAGLTKELQRYLRDACRSQALAESTGMKRFLEKEHGNLKKEDSFGIGWPSPAAFEQMGKGLVDNLMTASKGAADGGKTVFGGVTGVFSGIGKKNGRDRRNTATSDSRSSFQSTRESEPRKSIVGSVSSLSISDENGTMTSLPSEPRPSMSRTMSSASSIKSRHTETAGIDAIVETPIEEKADPTVAVNGQQEAVPHVEQPTEPEPKAEEPIDLDHINLPPPPSAIDDDYGTTASHQAPLVGKPSLEHVTPTVSTTASFNDSKPPTFTKPKPKPKQQEPFTEEEARITIELVFAIINELYTLSSVWTLRKSLLTAAKTFLLRPGNPALTSIKDLIQTSVLDGNTTDSAIAGYLAKIRENAMPTPEELAKWPKEMSPQEKEELRVKARRLVVERGVPPALVGVMGANATGEAVGRVFDALQSPRVLRGVMFEFLMQGVRVVLS
jgi:hypothetical protein